MMHLHWYVVHCEPHRDRQVERLIVQTGAETFAPRIPKTRMRNGDKPLFPGYVFTRLDLASGVGGELRYVPGVRSLVEVGGEPCPVDDGIVEAIRRRVTTNVPDVGQLRSGDRVTVVSGSFADLEAVFCEHLSGAERVAVLIEMMRRQVRVELSVDDVRPGPVRGVAA